MAIEVFNRVEEKYIVNENQYRKIVAFFGDNMKTDEYSSDGKFYQICNIYYDTEDNNLIRTSLMKPIYKEKFDFVLTECQIRTQKSIWRSRKNIRVL